MLRKKITTSLACIALASSGFAAAAKPAPKATSVQQVRATAAVRNGNKAVSSGLIVGGVAVAMAIAIPVIVHNSKNSASP